VCPNGEIVLKINGKCTVCLSNFQGVVIDQPLPTDIVKILMKVILDIARVLIKEN